MNKSGISGMTIGIIVVIIVLLGLGWYFMSNQASDAGQDSIDSGNADSGSDEFSGAIDDTNQLDSDLGLNEDFDYGIE